MKHTEQLQPPVDREPVVTIRFADTDGEAVDAAIDRWLRSLVETTGNPEEGRRR